MFIDPEALVVRKMKNGELRIENDEFRELFRIDPDVELPELLTQIVGLMNTAHRCGIGQGKRELSDDFKRLMSVHR